MGVQLKIFLNQPFYYLHSSEERWIYIISSTCFVFIFLTLFQPYGLSHEISNPVNSAGEILLFLFSVTALTFTGLSFSQILLRPALKLNRLRVKQYMLWYTCEVLLLTFFYFGISFVIPDLGDEFEKELNLLFQLKNFARAYIVLLFPFFGCMIYFRLRQLTYDIKELETQISEYHLRFHNSANKAKWLHIKDENENIDLTLRLKDFLYAESNNQYMLIHYIQKEGVRKQIVRNRLKNFVREAGELPLKRCHRSYVVNLLNVKYILKKGGKDYLILNDCDHRVPVSKSYAGAIKKEIGTTA